VRADLDRTLAALADPSRRAVVDLLRARSLQPSELANALSLSRPAMSRHLRILRRARLVDEDLSDSDGRVRMVRLRPEPFTELRTWIDEVEAFWTDQLRAFADHAQRRVGKKKKTT
jgi:DNA-binding transcriptional ArsR family regulator